MPAYAKDGHATRNPLAGPHGHFLERSLQINEDAEKSPIFHETPEKMSFQSKNRDLGATRRRNPGFKAGYGWRGSQKSHQKVVVKKSGGSISRLNTSIHSQEIVASQYVSLGSKNNKVTPNSDGNVGNKPVKSEDIAVSALSIAPEAYYEGFLEFFQTHPQHLETFLALITSELRKSSNSKEGDEEPEPFAANSRSPVRGFPIDTLRLLSHNPLLGYFLMHGAQNLLLLLDDYVLPEIFSRFCDCASLINKLGEFSSLFSQRWRARLLCVPQDIIPWKTLVSTIRNQDVGSLIIFEGTVIRAGEVKMLEEQKILRCRECSFIFRVLAAPELYYLLDVPHKCPSGSSSYLQTKAFAAKNPKQKRGRCMSEDFQELEEKTLRTDFQEIRVQEHAQRLEPGSIPRSIVVALKDDLTSLANPGDEVRVTGLVLRRWKRPKRGIRCEVELFIEANNVEVKRKESPYDQKSFKNSKTILRDGEITAQHDAVQVFRSFWESHKGDVLAARSIIIQSTCTHLYGMPTAKLALLLTMIGGCDIRAPSQETTKGRWQKYNPVTTQDDEPTLKNNPLEENAAFQDSRTNASALNTGMFGTSRWDYEGKKASSNVSASSNDRSQCHLLLVGAPSTGKSQFLKAASALSYRCISTTGIGCTTAGLTCAAVREGPDWMLEAGALVLADGGICCIDEFSSIRKDIKGAIHEAMEQQTISVAKAGLVCKLNSRCSVIAATNCLDYSDFQTKFVDPMIPLPLLSRFDCIVVISDSLKTDKQRTDFVLKQAMGSCATISEISSHHQDIYVPFTGAISCQNICDDVKTRNNTWSIDQLKHYIAYVRANFFPYLGEAAEMLISRYYTILREDIGGMSIRILESLRRLCQAHARLMFHPRASLLDAVCTIYMLEASLSGYKVGTRMKDSIGVGRQGILQNLMFDCNFDPFFQGYSGCNTLLSSTPLASLERGRGSQVSYHDRLERCQGAQEARMSQTPFSESGIPFQFDYSSTPRHSIEQGELSYSFEKAGLEFDIENQAVYLKLEQQLLKRLKLFKRKRTHAESHSLYPHIAINTDYSCAEDFVLIEYDVRPSAAYTEV